VGTIKRKQEKENEGGACKNEWKHVIIFLLTILQKENDKENINNLIKFTNILIIIYSNSIKE
jgi:hypothetical protein